MDSEDDIQIDKRVKQLFEGVVKEDWLETGILQTYFTKVRPPLIAAVVPGTKIYPTKVDIFRAFYLTSLADTKIVILGQDPYHDGKAEGLAFANDRWSTQSPSLANISKEIFADVDSGNKLGAIHASQGVLLLNTALTVEAGKPGSHVNYWQPFTNHVISILNDSKDNIVWMLWGRGAQGYKSLITNPTHLILESSHPSPLGATKTSSPFIGCRHFSKANGFLISNNITPIEW